MMGRDKLLALRKRVKAGETLSRDETLAVIDHGVGCWVEILGGESAVKRRSELAERERQVGIALAQLRDAIGPEPSEARYIVDAIMDMLKAKGPAWKREWAWYAPRVDEEFRP
jgi:hypothetical protein